MTPFPGKNKAKNLATILLVGSFLFSAILFFSIKETKAQTYLNSYSKPWNGTLSATEWNNLPLDFLNRNGSATMIGPLVVGSVSTSSSLTVYGPITGTLNATNISAGEFGKNASWGNFLFGATGPGNVGIGTTSVTYKLNVGGDINFSGDLLKNGVPFTGSRWSANGSSIYYNSGYVGVGTTNPVVKLVVQQADQSYAQPGASTTWDMALGIAANTNKISGMDFKNFNSSGQVRLMARNDQNDYLVMNMFGSANNTPFFGQTGADAATIFLQGVADPDKKLSIGTYNAGDLIFGTSNTERMRVISTGNVGIGTNNPTVKLDVNGQARFQSTVFPVVDIIRDTAAGGSSIYGGAKLERLTSAPANNGGIGFYFKYPDSTGASTYAGMFGGALSTITNGAEVGDIVFGAAWQGADPASSQHLIIRATGVTTGNVLIPNGNVGIGTTTPAAKLHVVGATGIINSGATQLMSLAGSGNVLVMADNTGTIYSAPNPSGTITLPSGISGQTLRHDGSVWIANSNLFNTGTNVGIGNSNPANKLSVTGAASFSGNIGIGTDVTAYAKLQIGGLNGANGGDFYSFNSASNPRFLFGANSGAGFFGGLLYSISDNSVRIYQSSAGTSQLVLANTGNMGIGVTNPQANLHIKSGVGLINEGSTRFNLLGGSGQVLVMADDTGTLYSVPNPSGTVTLPSGISGQTLRHDGSVWVANSNLFNTGANVGIGATNPSQKLDVNGLIKATAVISNGVGTHPTGIGTYVETYVYNGNTGRLFAYDGASYYDLAIGDWNSGNPNIMLKVGGNVGINRGSPTYKLDVAGTLRTDNGANLATVSGNVGIGLTNPAANLHIKNGVGLINEGSTRFNLLGGSGQVLVMADNTGTLYATSSDALLPPGEVTLPSGLLGQTLSHNGTVWMANSNLYNNNTNVGIGVTNPNYKLDVLGQVNASGGFCIGADCRSSWGEVISSVNLWTLSGSNLSASSTTWNIGIGTTTPLAKLHVVGNMLASGSLTSVGLINSGITQLTPLGGSGQVIVMADNTGTLYSTSSSALLPPGEVTLPSGISGQTLRHDGTVWVANSNLFNTGTNIGIGTNNPLLSFQVNGKVAIGDSINATRLNSLYGPRAINLIDSNASIRVWRFDSNTSNASQLELGIGVNDDFGNVANKVWMLGAWGGGQFTINDRTGGGNGVERLRIDSSGNIGIGVTNPVANLHIKSGVGLINEGSTRFNLLGGSGQVLVMADNTGTLYATSSDALLPPGEVTLPSGTSGSTLRHNGTVWLSNVNLYNNGTNVGIGTTNPAYRLDLGTTANTSTIRGYGFILGTTSNNIGQVDYIAGLSGVGRINFYNGRSIGLATYGPHASVLRTVQIERQDLSYSFPTGITNATYPDPTLVFRGSNTAGTEWSAQYFNSTTGHNFETYNHNIIFSPARTALMTLSSAGNVGIGVTNPNSKLQVDGTITSGGLINSGITQLTPLGGSGQVLVMADNTGTLYSTSSSALLPPGEVTLPSGISGQTLRHDGTVWVANSNLFNTGSNVGVGTTNPSTPLAVESSNHLALTLQRPANTAGWAVWEKFRLYNSSNSFVDYAYIGGGITSNTAGAHTGYLRFGTAQAGSLVETMSLSSAGNLQIDGTLSVDGTGNSYVNGNLGIGTNAPGTKLDVKNGGSTLLQVNSSYTRSFNNFLVANNGYYGWADRGGVNITAPSSGNLAINNANVGIGLTSPLAKLHITSGVGLINEGSTRFNLLGGSGQVLVMADNTGTLYATSSDALLPPGEVTLPSGTSGSTLRHNGTVWLSNVNLYNNGTNVGIGTTNPGAKLDVYSSTGGASSGIVVRADGGYASMDYKVTGSGPGLQTGLYQSGEAFFYNSDGGITFYTDSTLGGSGATANLVIKGNGNVGIGVTNPNSKLQVDGTITSGGLINSGITQLTPLGGSGQVIVMADNTGTLYSTSSSALLPPGEVTLPSGISGQTLRHDGTVWVANSNLYNNNTNVGIGTTNPGSRLTVSGADNKDAGPILNLSGSSVNQFESGRIRFTETTVAASPFYQGAFLHYDGSANTFNIGVHSAVDSLQASDINAIRILRDNGNVNIGNNALFAQYNGNVGVGTVSPAGKFDIGMETSTLKNWSSLTDNHAILDFYQLSGGTYPRYLDIVAAGDLSGGGTAGASTIRFFTNPGQSPVKEVMRIDGTGNIGIGITNPQANLHIKNGVGLINEGSTRFNLLGGSGQVIVMADNTGTLYSTSSSALLPPGEVTLPSGISGQTLRHDGTVWVANSNLFNTGTNIGIGTTNPTQKLHVTGSIQAQGGNFMTNGAGTGFMHSQGAKLQLVGEGPSYPPELRFFNGVTELFTVKSGGNVGIGTTNPLKSLHVFNAASSTAGIIVQTDSGDNSNWSAIDLRNHASEGWAGSGIHPVSVNFGSRSTVMAAIGAGYDSGVSYIDFHSIYNGSAKFDNDVVMRIRGNGNVGIGITNPQANLHIKNGVGLINEGSTRFNLLGGSGQVIVMADDTGTLFATSTSAIIPVIPDQLWSGTLNGNIWNGSAGLGNVGIGTTNPTEKLHIVGNVKISGTLQTQTGSDFAEEFSVTKDLPVGTVVIMDVNGYKSVKASTRAYDKTVVGIVSDNPSIIAGRVESEKKVIVAMMGVVSVNVCDDGGLIRKGDLLTTASEDGYAMKATEFKPGTVIGKALEDFSGGKGKIKVLVNLQ